MCSSCLACFSTRRCLPSQSKLHALLLLLLLLFFLPMAIGRLTLFDWLCMLSCRTVLGTKANAFCLHT